jgi:hypothetical protein
MSSSKFSSRGVNEFPVLPEEEGRPKIKGIFGTALGHMHQAGVVTNDHAAPLWIGPSPVFLDSLLLVCSWLPPYAFISRPISQAAT